MKYAVTLSEQREQTLYGLHTKKSIGKHPSIDLLFAIRRK